MNAQKIASCLLLFTVIFSCSSDEYYFAEGEKYYDEEDFELAKKYLSKVSSGYEQYERTTLMLNHINAELKLDSMKTVANAAFDSYMDELRKADIFVRLERGIANTVYAGSYFKSLPRSKKVHYMYQVYEHFMVQNILDPPDIIVKDRITEKTIAIYRKTGVEWK